MYCNHSNMKKVFILPFKGDLNILCLTLLVRLHFSSLSVKLHFCILINFPRNILPAYLHLFLGSSVTRLGDLLDFGQVFKAFGNN